MVARPNPTYLYHFTHVEHLPSLVDHGLLSDTGAQQHQLVQVDVGDQRVKERRRRRSVPVAPWGVVADYVPFYFAPRSPMMYKIHKGSVPTYDKGCDDLVYLVTTVERLMAEQLSLVFTDRNAAMSVAAFTNDLAEMEHMIDWPLMRARMWHNTAEEPDRMERRMAECLVHQHVPWTAFTEVVTKTPACARLAGKFLAMVGAEVCVRVVPGWYY